MATGLLDEMAKKTELPAKRNDVPVKMDAQVLADVRVVAAMKGLSIAEYISETMRRETAKDYEAEIAKRAKLKGSK